MKFGRDHGDAQQLLLKQRHAERALEDRLEAGMRILDRRFSLPPVEERFDHAADDRAGTDDRHLHDDVVELLRRVARQRRHLRAALHLEHADGVGLVQHLVDARVVLRQVREVDVDPFVRADERDHFLDRREHAEAEEIDFDDAEVRAVVFVPLDDDAAGHRRRLERHDFVEPSFGHDHAAGVLPEVPRQILDLHLQAHEVLHAQIGRDRSRRLRAPRGIVSTRSRISPKFQVPSGLRELVGLLEREAERLADFARRGAVAIRDHVRGHRRAVHAVRFVDVLDDALALIARGQIEVDVRPLAALLGQESLEQQLHLHRIDGGDAERVADRAVRRGAAALHENLLALAELDDVPDDEEVAGQVELLDHVQLFLDLRLRFARSAAGSASWRRSRRSCAGTTSPISPSRQRIVGKAVAEVGEREVERVGELPRAVERLGEIGEERGHLVGALDVALAIDAEEPAGVVDVAPFADAGEDVVQLLVLGARIADAVRGDERQAQAPREIDEARCCDALRRAG